MKEHAAIKYFSSIIDIWIKRSDKGKSVFLLNRHDYVTPTNGTLSDMSKFWNTDIKSGGEINYIDHRSISFLKSVQNSLSTNLYKELFGKGSQPGIIYSLEKIHKSLVNNFLIS